MRTLRSAAILLANTTSVECAGPLLAELRFSTDPVHLDAEARDRLGITDELNEASVSLGPGAARALVAELAVAHSIREIMSRLAAKLSSRTPHVLWTIILIGRESREIAIGCWFSGRNSPRVAALVSAQGHIVDSDCETLCAMADATSDSDIATHSRWLEILGREAVNRSFFRGMQSCVVKLAGSLEPQVPCAGASDLALLCLSRLLFLSFLETKSWLAGDHAFLANQFADCMIRGGGYHRRVLAPLFFGTLNTRPANRAQRARMFGLIPFLNGGLFTRSALERLYRESVFSDEALGDVFGELLTKYRFTAREDSSVWSEAAVDPEMLGKAFESLMAARERKTTGAFYTPQELVEQVTVSALAQGIRVDSTTHSAIVSALGRELPADFDGRSLLGAIRRLRVLDPACGSGAFLVHCMERLASLAVRFGDLRPMHIIRREILTRSIFGVDVNPTAVWLCELRLWLSTAIEDPARDPMKVVPLPNLDRNIRIGDSLSGGSFHERRIVPKPAKIAAVRSRYVRAVGRRKLAIARILDRLERECAIAALDATIERMGYERREIVSALRTRDLFGNKQVPSLLTRERLFELRALIRGARAARRNLSQGAALPFSFETQFADVGASGGFDIVLGNPPWVRLHNVASDAKSLFAREFFTFRNSAWLSGAEAASAGRGFAAQVDLAALFIERSMALVRPGGTVALLVPAKLWRSLAGGGVRSYLLEQTDLIEIHDLTESRQLFDAAVYPSVIVARRKHTAKEAASVHAVVHRRRSALHWDLDVLCIPFDSTPGSPWLLLPPDVRIAFDKVRRAGVSFAESSLDRPLLGVKTGCNAAFLVRPVCDCGDPTPHADSSLIRVESGERRGLIEREMLRPLHRGETIRAWKLVRAPEQIVWTHSAGKPITHLPIRTCQWLSPSRRQLEERTDARGRREWWTIFRTESADPTLPRVTWSDFGRVPRAAVLAAGDPTVLLNSCYVVRCNDLTDAHTLAALLNSPVIAAWLNVLAEPARGGYHRYLGWTVALMPIPSDWIAARRILAPLARRAMHDDVPAPEELIGAVVQAYRLRERDVEPLILWNSR